MLAKQLRHGGDGGAGAFEQRRAVLRIADRRRQHLGKRHGAVVAQQPHPGLEGAGYAGSQEAGAGNQIEAFAAVMRDCCLRGRYALPANDFWLAAPHVMDNHRNVAARTVEMRLDDLQGEGGGDAGVEGVAALFQDSHADGGGDPMRRRDHPESALDFRPGGEGIRVDIGHEQSLAEVGHADEVRGTGGLIAQIGAAA